MAEDVFIPSRKRAGAALAGQWTTTEIDSAHVIFESVQLTT